MKTIDQYGVSIQRYARQSGVLKKWEVLKLLIVTIALSLCAANAFAGGAGTMLIMTSEALDKELLLWSHCIKLAPDAPSDVKQECAARADQTVE